MQMVKNSTVMKQRWSDYRKDFDYAAGIEFEETCDAVITIMELIMPFDLRIPVSAPITAGSLSQAELNIELMKGVNSLKEGKGVSADIVEHIIQDEL